MDLSEVKHLGKELMNSHGLVKWSLTFDNRKARAGACKTYRFNTNPELSIGVIFLSREFMSVFDRADVEETILHEIAHALNNPKNKAHGAEWKAICRRIGSDGSRLVSKEAPSVESRYVGTCRGGHTFNRHRLSWKYRDEYYCPKCSTKESKAYITWQDTKNAPVKSVKSVKQPHPVDVPVAAQSAKPKSWKEKFDEGMTVIEW